MVKRRDAFVKDAQSSSVDPVARALGQSARRRLDTIEASFAGTLDIVELDAETIIAATALVAPGPVPASASAAGIKGTITSDASFIYICTATNTWKRVAIATW